jgi:hypothetical protein
MGWLDDIWNGIVDTGEQIYNLITYPLGSPVTPEVHRKLEDGPLDEAIKPVTDVVGEATAPVMQFIFGESGDPSVGLPGFFRGIGDWFNGLFGGFGKWLGDIGGWLQANWWIIAIIGFLILLLYVKGGGVGAGGGGGTDDRDISVTVKPEFHFTDSLKKRMPKRRQSR